MNKEIIILGIDPGTILMGYGVIKITNNHIELLSMGSIELKKYTCQTLKLKKIAERTKSLIETYSPDECAIEAPFMGQNAQSMLKLGRAQGVAMATSLIHNIPISEYAPRKIKQVVTGNGASSKEQVAKILQYIFKFHTIPKYLDATDGLSVAYCHYINIKSNSSISLNNHLTPKKLSSKNENKNKWEKFLLSNPNRIRQ